jgi:hypothetical protein
MAVGVRRDANSAARHGVRGVASQRPWWVWTVPFGVVAGVLLARNSFIFSTPLYEDADMGANSILIEQARRFSLLVGNYSREGFNHPGPAFLYVQSWGESLFWSVLHVVPTAWSGQLIALYALNALFAALVVGTGYGWTRSVRGAAAVFAVVLLYGVVHPAIFSSDWMPYVYVPAYFCFLVAVASVAAGRVQDAWIAALSGWFLIHGQACFLLFVPFLAVCAVAALGWPRRRSLGSSLRRFLSGQRRTWIPVAVISVLFLIPIVAELALHWPGNFGKYFSYGSSSHAGGHSAGQVLRYVLWFWWQGRHAWAVPLVLYAAAIVVTWLLPAGPVRRFLAALLVFDALSTLAFVAYAAVGIDELNSTGYYIGYFYWSAPVIAAGVIVLGAVEALPSRAGAAVAVAGAVAACAAFAVAPQTRTSTSHTDPGNLATGADTDPTLPAGVARLAAMSGGKPIVLGFDHNAWPDVTGLLVQAERTGVTACVANSYWKFMMTSQFICTPAEVSRGAPYWLSSSGVVPHGERVVFRLRRAIVTSRAK